MKNTFIPHERLRKFIFDVLVTAGACEGVARYVSEGLVQTSLRGVDSHGVRLFPHYLAAMKAGRINPKPDYKFKKTSMSTGILDADHTFGHASGMEAAKKAIDLAKEAGTGHVAIYNSTHFGAAAYYALEIAKHDMIGMSFTHADALMKTHNGKRAFFGTNPVAFSAPLKDEEPFCLDMATTVFNFNKIKQLREKKEQAPLGVGADSNGKETTDPDDIRMLLPIGSYKGYGLAMVVEILCGMLTGMPYGPYLLRMFDVPLSEKRFLGHFISAMRIDCFQDKEIFKERFTKMVKELRSEPALDPAVPVQVAGDPEKKSKMERFKKGIPLNFSDFDKFLSLGKEYGISL